MRNIWITSDTHLFHSNILKFSGNDGNLIRGNRFSSVEEMNECILENWNSVVAPGDIVYHLGDVFIGAREDFARFWPKNRINPNDGHPSAHGQHLLADQFYHKYVELYT